MSQPAATATHITPHVDDHLHDQPLSDIALRSIAIESLPADKGLLTADARPKPATDAKPSPPSPLDNRQSYANLPPAKPT